MGGNPILDRKPGWNFSIQFRQGLPDGQRFKSVNERLIVFRIFPRHCRPGFFVQRRVFIFSIGLIVFLGVFLSSYPLHLLVFEKNDEWILVRTVRPGDIFTLTYLHSVSLSDVREIFRIDEQYRMVLSETEFQGQGAGLPSAALPNERWTREGKRFRISGMQRMVPSPLLWRVDSQWKNRFQFAGENEQLISSRTGDGLIKVQIRKSGVLQWLLYRLKGFFG
jgi:hypothetical protein